MPISPLRGDIPPMIQPDTKMIRTYCEKVPI